MTAYLTGKWELSGGSSQATGNSVACRHYCDVTNNVSTLAITNYNNAWRTDGSESGRSTSYEAGTVPGSYSAAIAGSIYSGTLNYAVPGLPTLAAGPFYPTIQPNGSGGWNYEPIATNLPTTFALDPDDMNAGYPSDVKIEIVVRSSSAAATFMRATAIDLTFDSRWNTLWLEENTGDGLARAGSRVINGQTVATVGFATTYNAWWRTAYFQPGAAQIPGIAGFRVDTSVGAGTYWLSALVAAGLAVTTPGYLLTTPVNTPNYVIQ